MRVLIFGAGGVGGYLGAKLSQNTNAKVEFVAREKHLETIQRYGLKLIEKDKESTIKAKAIDSNSLSGVYDLVLVTVKGTDLDGAIESISNHISKDSFIIPIMNGVDNAKKIKSKIEDAKVLNGCIYIISNIKSAGVVEKKGDIFKLCWGDSDISFDEVREIKELFDRAGFRHKFTEDIELEVWRKFLFIAPMALLTSYYTLDMSEIYQNYQNELKMAMGDVVKVANALGVKLSELDIQKNLSQASKVQKRAKTSMQLDIESRKPFEIESLGGFLVKEAEAKEINLEILPQFYYKLAKIKA